MCTRFSNKIADIDNDMDEIVNRFEKDTQNQHFS